MRYFFLSLILVMVMGCGGGEVKDITYDLEIHHGERSFYNLVEDQLTADLEKILIDLNITINFK